MGFEVNDYYRILFFVQSIYLNLCPLIRSQSVPYIPGYPQDGMFLLARCGHYYLNYILSQYPQAILLSAL